MYKKLFLDHPRQVEETYFQHFIFALKFASLLALAAFAACVHAVIPAFFEKTASTIVADLFQKINRRSR